MSWGKNCSVYQFSSSVMFDSLRPHGLQHTTLPCPSPSPRACSNSFSLSQWCHPVISSSVVPFSSCPQSLPASESFPMSQLFAWGGQSIGVLALASVLPKNIHDWSPLEWTAIGIHISPSFWNSLPSPSPSHPSRLIQSPCLSFLSHTGNFHWLFILHMVM